MCQMVEGLYARGQAVGGKSIPSVWRTGPVSWLQAALCAVRLTLCVATGMHRTLTAEVDSYRHHLCHMRTNISKSGSGAADCGPMTSSLSDTLHGERLPACRPMCGSASCGSWRSPPLLARWACRSRRCSGQRRRRYRPTRPPPPRSRPAAGTCSWSSATPASEWPAGACWNSSPGACALRRTVRVCRTLWQETGAGTCKPNLATQQSDWQQRHAACSSSGRQTGVSNECQERAGRWPLMAS